MLKKDDARPHLDKASEYLHAAQVLLHAGLNNAACSVAIISGINSKDVICIPSVGHTGKGESHLTAISDLRRAGPLGARLAPTLERLLAKKTRSQYSPSSVTAADAHDAWKRANRLFEAAQEILGRNR